MRIALVSTPFVDVPPRCYGGTELVVHELLHGLAAAGHRVTLFATGRSRWPDLRYVYPSPAWPPDPHVELVHCRHAAGVIDSEPFDLVHAHAPAMALLADQLEVPCVYTLHHVHDERLTRIYRQRPKLEYVAISARQAALEPELRCHVVHHGLDADAYPLGGGEGDYAAFLGRIAPCKGPEAAISAALASGARIRLAGEIHAADATPAWRRRITEALGRPGVEHLGPVGGGRKMRFLGAARALLMPLRWEEPFGLAMVEAMLCGTPVIAFPRGSAPEVVDEGVTGFLAQDEEEMARVLASLRGFDRAACRRRAQARFSVARMVHEYEQVYAAAIASRARGLPAASPEESAYAG